MIQEFGAALTESAGYTLARMSKEKQKEVVEAYYGADGIGYTLGWVHMDSSDFSISNYCAVQNQDGTNVLVILHKGSDGKVIHLRTEGKVTRLIVPGDSISTVVLE